MMLKELGYPNFFTEFQLRELGFKKVGKNVKISSKCSFYVINGTIGDDVRVDDFCILKGKIEIGNNVHICSYSMISGVEHQVTLRDFCVLAARCSIYTASNNHSADALPAPLAPIQCTSQIFGPVTVGAGVMVGAHVVILPGVTIGDGASVGAACVVSENIREGAMMRAADPKWSGRTRNVSVIKGMIARYFEKTGARI